MELTMGLSIPLCLDSKTGGGKIFDNAAYVQEKLCLDSKTGGGKIAGHIAPPHRRLCLDSKTGGGKIGRCKPLILRPFRVLPELYLLR